MAETVVYTPENNQANNLLPYALLGQNNGGLFGGNNGWGGGILGFFLGLLCGNGGFGGFGNFGGGLGNAGTGFLANQINNDAGRELLNQAIVSQGEASRAATQSLATMLGQDFGIVNSAIQTIQSALCSMATQQAVSVPQIINAIQSGSGELKSQLYQCCCEMKQITIAQGYENQIATLNQTNQLAGAISGSGQRTVDAIADLKTTMVKEFCDARERDMQAKIDTQAEIITQLRNASDNKDQTNLFQSAFNVLNQKITELASKTPNTVPVQWPQLTAVNTTPTAGVSGFGWGSGLGWGGWGNPGNGLVF